MRYLVIFALIFYCSPIISQTVSDTLRVDSFGSVNAGSEYGSASAGSQSIGSSHPLEGIPPAGGTSTNSCHHNIDAYYTYYRDDGSIRYYGTYNIQEDLKEVNYLFLSFCLFVLSIYLIHISATSWLRYKHYVKLIDLREKRSLFVNERDTYIKIKDEDFSKEKSDIIKDLNKKINSLDENDTDFNYNSEVIIYLNAPFFLIGTGLFYLYYTFITTIKNIPSEFFMPELYGYPLQFAFPILFFALILSAVSIIRFTLISSGNLNSRLNKLSIFGILISLINLTACIMTIIQFTNM
ncbi:MAG: hypothetical protein WDZ45_12200 [Flavobacteriaceae bacterium]